MPKNMDCLEAPAAQMSQFALVSYIPDPLGVFLDRLRLELVPNCSPHAHVTVLPPRPIHADPSEAARELAEEARPFVDFEVELGEVEMFPISKVIYIGVKRGEKELRDMYEALNRGTVAFNEPFPYHPHITLAQNVPTEQVMDVFHLAQRRWAEYNGSRSFPVTSLDFVKNLYGNCWKDLASISLAEHRS